MVNLIENGSFERGDDAWVREPEDDLYVRITDAKAFKGRKCAQFRWRHTVGCPVYLEQTLEDPAAFFWPGHLSFYLRSDHDKSRIQVELHYAGVTDSEECECPKEWTLTTVPIRRFRTLERIRFVPLNSARNYVDCVSLKAPSAPWVGFEHFLREPSFRWAPPGGPGASGPAEDSAAGSAAALANAIAMEDRLIGIEKRLQEVVAALSQLGPQAEQEEAGEPPPLEQER